MPQPAGLQAGLLSVSAGRRGRSGVSEPAASSGFLPSLPVDQSQPPEGLPLYQLPHGPCGREAKEGRVGVPAAGGRAGRGRKGQTVGRGWPTSRVGKARSCEPGSPPSTLTRSLGKDLALTSRLRAEGAPVASKALFLAWSQGGAHSSSGGSSGGSGSQALAQLRQQQLLTQVLSCGGEGRGRGEGEGGGEKEREGTAGGRGEEGKMLKS